MNTSLRLTVAAAALISVSFSHSPVSAQCRSQQSQYGGGHRTLPYPYPSPPTYQPDPIYAQPGCDQGKCTTARGSLTSWLPPNESPAGSQDPAGQQTVGNETEAGNTTPAPSRSTVPDADLPVLTAGETLPVKGVAETRGLAQLSVSGLLLNLSVLDWQGGTATIQLPNLNIDKPVRAELRMLTAAGELQRAVEVMFEPAKSSPAQSEPQLPTIVAGEDLTLTDSTIGKDSGQVKLKLAGVAINVEILDWKAGTIVIQLPDLPLTEAVNAELQVLNADGSEIALQAVQFAPAAQG